MKTSNWRFFLTAIIASLFIISCGPASVAVRSRPVNTFYARPIAPSPSYIWVGDNYTWRGNRYVYQPGYWSAPQPRKVYVQGYWSNNRRGSYWVPGHWQRR